MNVLNYEQSQLVMNGIIHEASQAAEAWKQTAYDQTRPSVVWKPRFFIDGNKWCALYGENIQDGIAGFGDSPEKASYDFDKSWYANLPASPRAKEGA